MVSVEPVAAVFVHLRPECPGFLTRSAVRRFPGFKVRFVCFPYRVVALRGFNPGLLPLNGSSVNGSSVRSPDSLVEAEAACLGGCILVPNEAAHRIAALRISVEEAAESFGVSEEMIRYRLRVSGALRPTGRRV